MKTAKLHQLIEWANQGKKFKAIYECLAEWLNQDDFKTCDVWSTRGIVADWEYQEIKEPEVVEFDVTIHDSVFFEWHQPEAIIKLSGKKWRIVATEIVEE